MNKNAEKLGNMDVKILIIKMALPAMISMIVQALYNIVDSIFVARISEKALTALSFAFPIQMIIVSIFVGLGVGVNSYISRKLGEGKKDEAINTAEHGLLIGIAIWSLLAISSFILPKFFFKFFTNDPVIIKYSVQYTRIVMLFSFGSILTEVCMNILRASGDMISSMKIQLLGALINIILDPIFIFGFLFIPALGVTGAAIATVIGQLCAMTFALTLVLKNKKGLELDFSKFKYSLNITKEIFRVGVPAIFMQLLGSFMLTGVNLILAGISSTSVAVFGAYFKLQSFIYMPVFGLNQGMMPVVGYNYGAKKYDRVASAVKYSVIYAAVIMLFGFILFQLFPRPLLALFNSSEQMYEIGVVCLRTISYGFIFSAGGIVLSTLFQALGKGSISLFLSFARQIIFLLPLAFVFSGIIGVQGVWFAFPISEVLSLIIAIFFTVKVFKRMDKGNIVTKKYA